MQDKKKIAVVAIGGNFLSDGKSPMDEQMERAYKAAELIKTFVNRNFKVVVVHGNGPQVGMSYLRQLSGQKEGIPPLNLAMCNALTQAQIGTTLELAIINTLNREKPDADVLTLVSQVEVKADDPAFENPTKPIGPFLTKEEAETMKKTFPDWTMVEDSGRGYRRVVPSPVPVNVFSSGSISDTFKTADVIIAGGGGGIPVVRNPKNNTFELVDSVIDKDRTAFLIAEAIKATHFVLLTGVPHVCTNFGKPTQENLFDVTVAQAQKYLDEGQFPPGSMGPKIESAIKFAETTGGTAIITDADNIAEALEEKEGTRIHL
ncbi:MAG: carbamate kinase [bacterium]|nr:carbamate kinase [bacterium]